MQITFYAVYLKHIQHFFADIDLYGSSDHGTHCSGIISAVRNNNRGIAGITGGNGTFGSGVFVMNTNDNLQNSLMFSYKNKKHKNYMNSR